MDTPKDVASGQVPGTKRAARRKLEHELGIPPHQIPLDRLQYLTRLHYCAGDTGLRGMGPDPRPHRMHCWPVHLPA